MPCPRCAAAALLDLLTEMRCPCLQRSYMMGLLQDILRFSSTNSTPASARRMAAEVHLLHPGPLVTDTCMPVPLQYVLHFPRTEKYVSLLKAAPDAAAQEQLEAERARLRGLVKQHLAEVAMLTQGDEGRSTLGGQYLPASSPLSGAPLSGTKRKQAEVGHPGIPVDLPHGHVVVSALAAVRYLCRSMSPHPSCYSGTASFGPSAKVA